MGLIGSKIISLGITALLLFAGCGGQPSENESSIAVPDTGNNIITSIIQYNDGIERAESICPYNGGILISNFGSDSSGGYILFRSGGKNEVLVQKGAGLIRPTGMAVGKGHLFVCDGDSIKTFELDNISKGFNEIRISESGHLFNDAAVEGDNLYFSVTDQDCIYKVNILNLDNIERLTPEKLADVPGPNGIAVKDNTMYIASISKDFTSVEQENVIYRISDLSRPVAERFTDIPGLYDGVALSDDGETLYYSDWNISAVNSVDIASGKTETVYYEAGIGPADIAQENGTLYVPELTGSRIMELKINNKQNTPVQNTAFDFIKRTVTLNSGYEMPVLGLGMFSLSDSEAENSTYWALKAGFRMIDTARIYGNEAAVGRGLQRAVSEGIVSREDVFITTKMWTSDFGNGDAAINASLDRLGVDYIDLMILHHSQPSNDIQAYQAMEKAVADGRLRSIGLSNYYEPDDFDRIIKAAAIKPALLQNETHPYHQSTKMKEHISQYGTVMESWFPLGGRGNTQTLFNDETISSIAAAHGKSPAQIIIRWHLQAGNICIPGSSNEQHIVEDYNIWDFELTEDEMQRISALDRDQRFADY